MNGQEKVKHAGGHPVACERLSDSPGLERGVIGELTEQLAEIGADEYFVDPMQPYSDSLQAFKVAFRKAGEKYGLVAGKPEGSSMKWSEIQELMQYRGDYLDWKFSFYQRWRAAWLKLIENRPELGAAVLPIWSDHERKTWVDMRSGEQMSRLRYGE